MIFNSDGESDSEGIKNERCTPHLQDTETSAPQEPSDPKLASHLQTTPMPSPVVISNGQQELTLQQLTETHEYDEPEDSNTGR
jgi:hypothetical protein